MIKFLGEHQLFSDLLVIIVALAAGILEMIHVINGTTAVKERRISIVIGICYLAEAILFAIPSEGTAIDFLCTVFGAILLYGLVKRWIARKR